MFDSSELKDELESLKGDVSRLLNTAGEGIFDTGRNRAEALADQIKAALNELGATLSEQEETSRRYHLRAADHIDGFRLCARRRGRLHVEETLE